MELKKIRFLSASDRINYGDFLFPLVFQEVLKRIDSGYAFENYGIIKSNYAHFGAFKTKSFRALEAEIEAGDKVIVGGGEVLFANWTTLYAFINPVFNYLMQFKKLRKLENKIGFANRWLSLNQVYFPFSFKASDFNLPALRVYYSSVGGGYLLTKNNKMQNEAYSRMLSAQSISVRDNRSLSYFSNCPELKARVIPDSAILISDFYPKKNLQQYVGDDLEFDAYIFLQLGINKGPKNLIKFADRIEQLSKELQNKVVLCPIGLAPGHEDHKILQRLKKLKPHFDFVMPKNIFEIMYLIANSNLYLGTSLHGAITAMSFLTPAIGLNKEVPKLESYMKTWISESFESLDFDDVYVSEVQRLLHNFKTNFNQEKLENQKQMVQSNLESIIND